VLALPWLIPALTNPGGTPADHVGVDVFASRPDTPFGTVGSLLSLGGVWNTTTVPPGRSHWYAALGALVVTAAALWGLLLLRRQRGSTAIGGIALAAGIGLFLALWSHLAGLNHLLRWLSSHSQAFDLLRDGQRSLAPFVLAVAIGWGWAVAELATQARRAVVLAAVPLLLLPSAAWAVSGKLAAVTWPKDWSTIATASRALPAGPVLVLPWASVRLYPWNGDRPMIDPASRWLRQRVVGDGRLFVGTASGAVVSTVQEDPLARTIEPAVSGTASLTSVLRSQGYAGVLVERDVQGAQQQTARLGGTTLVTSTPTLALFAVTATTPMKSTEIGSTAATVVGDVLALLAVTTAGTICCVSAVHRRRSV